MLLRTCFWCNITLFKMLILWVCFCFSRENIRWIDKCHWCSWSALYNEKSVNLTGSESLLVCYIQAWKHLDIQVDYIQLLSKRGISDICSFLDSWVEIKLLSKNIPVNKWHIATSLSELLNHAGQLVNCVYLFHAFIATTSRILVQH